MLYDILHKFDLIITISVGGALMYNVIDVAKYIILYCKQHGYSISNLKLQKLLYFVQAQFLVALGKPAFSEEIEAWDFGPVVPEAYRYFKIWGSSEIPAVIVEGAESKIRFQDQEIMDAILEQCAPYSASYLVELTHHQKPWKKAYNGTYNRRVISQESIREYFK